MGRIGRTKVGSLTRSIDTIIYNEHGASVKTKTYGYAVKLATVRVKNYGYKITQTPAPTTYGDDYTLKSRYGAIVIAPCNEKISGGGTKAKCRCTSHINCCQPECYRTPCNDFPPIVENWNCSTKQSTNCISRDSKNMYCVEANKYYPYAKKGKKCILVQIKKGCICCTQGKKY